MPGLPFLDLCSQCGHDLKLVRPRRVKPAVHEKALWMARAVDKLIERTCASHIVLAEDAFSSKLRDYVDRYAEGEPAGLARLINLGDTQIRSWLKRKAHPGFVVALDLFYRLDCPPDRFLLDPMELLDSDIWRQKLRRPRFLNREGYTEKQILHMGKALNKIVQQNRKPPPRIVDTARRLGVRYCYLRLRFPGQYAILMKRSVESRSKIAKLKFANRIGRLKRGYRELMARGIYPSQRQLKRNGYLLPSELRLATIRAELAKLHKNTAERVFRHMPKDTARKKRRRKA
jgi:hypothetical protein